MKSQFFTHFYTLIVFILLFITFSAKTKELNENPELDARVKEFLDSHEGQWYDMNVPTTDGEILYDIIIKNNYKSALEIGTSTGHSAIWIAWALSKTGGKLVTIEIDKGRHKTALENFEKTGLAEFIDARLANAHDLVPQLQGPFDFVFSDADKDWYTNYFKAIDPKLQVGGCFTAHNVSMRYRGGGAREFYEYIKSLPNYESSLDKSSRSGLSVSYKKAEK